MDRPVPRFPWAIVVALAVIAPAAATHAACDTAANAVSLAATRYLIDVTCDCAAALKPSDHAKCARPIVAARVANGALPKTCKSEALRHATKSICGRPGAVVCCRVKANGKTSHKVAKVPAMCADTPTLTTCISTYDSVPSGCSASGCVSPVCGDGVVEGPEGCDPPDTGMCDANCQPLICDPPVTDCGNGVVDAGETCDPPGVGACDWTCQTATCAGGGPTEIDVACAADGATVGAGARGAQYLLAWNDRTHKPVADIVARRLDSDGDAFDAAATVVSEGAPCGGDNSQPAVGSNASGHVVGWYANGPYGPIWYAAIYARPYDAAGNGGTIDQLVLRTPFGMCQSSVFGPISIAPTPPAGSEVSAVVWQDTGGCVFGPFYRDAGGILLDHADDPPGRTTLDIGYFPVSGPLPQPFAEGTASLATLGTDTLAVIHAFIQDDSPPYVSGHFVSGEWIAADGTTTKFSVSSRQPGIGDAPAPGIAAGDAGFLVVWADGPVDVATDIRAMRVAPGGGALDPDGGLLLATTNGGASVIGRPVVAFDGSVWLVAWTEVGVAGNDLYAVAVATDGTVLDATPRLLASGLSNATPAIASAGDGRSLVTYVRPDGGKSAVRAQLVDGQ